MAVGGVLRNSGVRKGRGDYCCSVVSTGVSGFLVSGALPMAGTRRSWRCVDPMICCSSSLGAEGGEQLDSEDGHVPSGETHSTEATNLWHTVKDWYEAQRAKSKVVRDTLIGYGPAAVLAYGLFDGVSYSIAFVIAFLGYEARTGLNPTNNVGDIVKICILMWAGNNVTRPFRLAGAAALAPPVDILLNKVQKKLGLPRKIYAFFILTAIVAAVCLSAVGALIFSRWIQG